MKTIQNMIATFHSTYENGSILCEHAETSKGISVAASTMSGDRRISAVSHLVIFDELSNLDTVNRLAVREALILAGIPDESAATPDTEKKTTKTTRKKLSVEANAPEEPKANPVGEITCAEDEELSGEVEEPDGAIEEPKAVIEEENPSAEDAPDTSAGSPVEEPADPKESDAEKTMTVEEARAVILTVKPDAKTAKKVEVSSLKDYVGKSLGVFADDLPSLVPVLAARAGKDSSMLSPETERAIKVLADKR